MSFFDDAIARVHSACDEIFGVEAVLRPAAGGAYTCVVELTQPEPEFAAGKAKTVAPDLTLRVVKSLLPVAPRKDDVFEVGTGDLRVLVAPTTDDDDGARWTCKVEKVTA